MAGLRSFVVVFIVVVVSCCALVLASEPPIAEGLSMDFYETSCPNVRSIVGTHLYHIYVWDSTGVAASLLRLHYHDCFVQGCDGSVLLDGSASGPSDQDAPPYLRLRAKAFEIIEELRDVAHQQCGRVVSCADIIAIATRFVVFWEGGPFYDLPLGRRDGLTFATHDATLANLPPPSANASTIVDEFAKKGLDPTDVVALSGGHTIGFGHCSSFGSRLYPTQDPVMNKYFADKLKKICPTATTNKSTSLDIRTPYMFDNKYYVNLMNRQGLFTSDQDLYSYDKTKDIVSSFALNESLFLEKFGLGMIKMGQLGVLTGDQGEIRANCSIRNSDNKSPYYLATLDNLETLSSVF